MDKTLIENLFAEGKLEQAQHLLEGTRDAWGLYMLGRIAWRQGRRADAIGFYEQSVALDPESPAKIALEQVHDIMAFYNKDLYNP